MASIILGVSGRKRAGKDTFAARLVDAHGFTRFAFADAMKRFALALDPVVWVEQDERGLFPLAVQPYVGRERLSRVVAELGWEKAKEIREVRRSLQRLGTEAGRGIFGPDFWVERTAAQIAAHDGPVVITDVRFPNEADYVEAAGGDTVRVLRSALPQAADLHPSETALDGRRMSWLVRNDGSLEDLQAKADHVAATLLHGE